MTAPKLNVSDANVASPPNASGAAHVRNLSGIVCVRELACPGDWLLRVRSRRASFLQSREAEVRHAYDTSAIQQQIAQRQIAVQRLHASNSFSVAAIKSGGSHLLGMQMSNASSGVRKRAQHFVELLWRSVLHQHAFQAAACFSKVVGGRKASSNGPRMNCYTMPSSSPSSTPTNGTETQARLFECKEIEIKPICS